MRLLKEKISSYLVGNRIIFVVKCLSEDFFYFTKLQDETGIIKALGFCAPYIRDFKVMCWTATGTYSGDPL